MILLDFYSGSHGHFLEYVINTYIFQGPRLKNIFTPLGTSHLPTHDVEYKKHQIVRCNHFSEFDIPSPQPAKVIRITISKFIEQVCYQINVDSRAGDIPQEKKIQQIPINIQTDPVALRNQYYSKLLDVNNGYCLPGNWKWNNISIFEFEMINLYNLVDFYSGLRKIAHFVDHSFNPDESLHTIWKQFIDMNHGAQAWKTCQNLLEKSLANQSFQFQSTFIEQALLNSLLTNTIGICDGPLFTCAEYPTNTQDIYTEISSFVKTFDSRF